MRKVDELGYENSCLNKALIHERLFVLLGRDTVAADVIRYWVHLRTRDGMNDLSDPQIQEALDCARLMDIERRALRGRLRKLKKEAAEDMKRDMYGLDGNG